MMFICCCMKLPPAGNFTIGKYYDFTYVIDAVQIQDDKSSKAYLTWEVFSSCFAKTEPSTSLVPYGRDTTLYCLYILLENDTCSREEIRACAKTLNINYLQARKKLNQIRNLIFQGNSAAIGDLCKKLAPFPIQYEIDPPYPYYNASLPQEKSEAGRKENNIIQSFDLYKSLVDCLVRLSNKCVYPEQIERRDNGNELHSILEKLEDEEQKILAHVISEVYSEGILDTLKELELMGEYANMVVTLRNQLISNDLFKGIAADYVKRRKGWQWPEL